MSQAPHIFPAAQASFLRAMENGTYRASALSHGTPSTVSLVKSMPPVYQQSLQGTCVANAVTALLEYHCDCRLRLSVQFLHAATKAIERAGMERELVRVASGEAPGAAFEAIFHANLAQLRMLADANGGMQSPAMGPYVRSFVDGVRERFAMSSGSLLRSCFAAVESQGVCRYSLWPYASTRAAGLFNGVDDPAFPPGSREDALKHRVVSGLYLLPTPNNVDEIRGILSGANSRRPMPVAVTVDFFEGRDGETYAFPDVETAADGNLVSVQARKGVHCVLLVGYHDSSSSPGGGYFIFRNSMGEAWGNRGYGKIPYAYVECFAVEAGTIMQDMVDYAGDGYGGLAKAASAGGNPRRKRSLWVTLLINLLLALLVAGITIAIGVFFDDPLGLRHDDPPPVSPALIDDPASALSVPVPPPATPETVPAPAPTPVPPTFVPQHPEVGAMPPKLNRRKPVKDHLIFVPARQKPDASAVTPAPAVPAPDGREPKKKQNGASDW